MSANKKNQVADAVVPEEKKGADSIPATLQSGNLDEIVDQEVDDSKAIEENDATLMAVPVEAIPLGIALPCSIYIKIGNKYPLFRGQGERLDSKRILALQEKGASALYIHKALWRMFLQTLEKMKVPDTSPEKAAIHLRTLLVAYGQELERKIREPKKPLFDKLRSLSSSLAMAIRQDPVIGGKLLRKYSDPGLTFVNHSVNTCIYACVISYKMGLTEEELKILAYGALIHDVGKLSIPKKILYKKSALTTDEEGILQEHPRRGAELLLSLGSPPQVVTVALQHHERIDGDGFPGQLEDSEIHAFAKIVSIADAYDSLTTTKHYRVAITPGEAIKKMRSDEGQFDEKILGMVAVG